MPAIKSYTTFPLRKQVVTPFIRKESFLTKQCHGKLKGILYNIRFPALYTFSRHARDCVEHTSITLPLLLHFSASECKHVASVMSWLLY